MTSKDSRHTKHGSITKPTFGEWGRSEFAIYGTTCDQIAEIVKIIRDLFPEKSIAYLDAHHDDENKNQNLFDGTQCTIHGSHGNLISPKLENKYSVKSALSDNNLVIVNGNHFQATSQIIICNSAKENSLRKRTDELTNVKLILIQENDAKVPEYVHDILGEKIEGIPVIHLGDLKSIQDFIEKQFLPIPILNALILVGGKSSRMGKDKSRISYHGVEQIQHVKNMTESLGLQTFISCRADQSEDMLSLIHI